MMPKRPHIGATLGRVMAVTALLAVAGCAIGPTTTTEDGASPAQPEPAPLEGDARPAESSTSPAGPVRTPAPQGVAVLFASDIPGHAEVAAQIADQLPADAYQVRPVDIRAAESAAAVDALQRRPGLVVVAVGLGAVEYARARLGGHPMVFCQVFNYQDVLRENESIWGVHSVPPLALQLQAWKAVDPSLRRIGLIVSESQSQWLEEAGKAADRAGIELRPGISASDRETLYLFKRLAPQIDGFWLLPDNRILSPAVLEELLGYALSHDVGVLVFNETLLGWGALMSASGTTANIAQAVREVVARVASGRTKDLPAMTALSEVAMLFNAGIAQRLGKEPVPEASWVLREHN